MATFTTYGATFNVTDKWAEGQPLTAGEALALNARMAEFISHKVRSGPFKDLSAGDEPSPEQLAEAQALVDAEQADFEFTVRTATGPRQATNPLETEARNIARTKVRKAIKDAGMTLAKKDTEAGEGEFAFDAYEAKVEELAQHPAVIKAAEKVLKLKSSDDGVAVDLTVAAAA